MINIAKILKDTPKGMKLYSPLFGEVKFVGIDKQSDYPINVTDCKGNGKSFTEFGVYFADHPDAECLLFPSKDCRTWEGWKLPIEPKFKFKVGDWIVQNDNGTVSQITKTINGKDEYGEYRAYEHTNGYFAACFENEYHLWTIADARDGDVITNGKLIVIFNKLEEPAYKQHIIAYVGLDLCGKLQITEDTWQLGVDKAMPATKKQSDLLFKKIKEAGYQWDSDNKELRKIQPHYDIANFHAGMPVLVRDNNGEEWRHTAFSHMTSRFYENKFAAGCTYWCQCIPFNDDTKHLLGTTDMPSEEYINW